MAFNKLSQKIAAMEEDRREFLRIDCLIETHVLSIVENDELASSDAFAKNISASGVLFRTKIEYQLDSIVSMEIFPGILNELDDNEAKIIKTRGYVLGKVVRVKKGEDDGYDCAVAFVSSDVEDEEYLRLFQDLINKAMYFG